MQSGKNVTLKESFVLDDYVNDSKVDNTGNQSPIKVVLVERTLVHWDIDPIDASPKFNFPTKGDQTSPSKSATKSRFSAVLSNEVDEANNRRKRMSAMSIDLGIDVKDLYRAVLGINTASMRGIGFDSVENTPGLPPKSKFMKTPNPQLTNYLRSPNPQLTNYIKNSPAPW